MRLRYSALQSSASAAAEILEQSIEKSRPRERWLGRDRGDADLCRRPFELLLQGAQLRQRGGYVDALEAGALVWLGRAGRIGSKTLRQAGMNSLERQILRLRCKRPANRRASQLPTARRRIVDLAEAPTVTPVLPGLEVFDIQGQ